MRYKNYLHEIRTMKGLFAFDSERFKGSKGNRMFKCSLTWPSHAFSRRHLIVKRPARFYRELIFFKG